MLVAPLVSLQPLHAAERNADFLAALRQAGWEDTAVEFLDWVDKSPLTNAEFRKQIPYQRALSLASQARQTLSREERNRMLTRAAEDFKTFAESDLDGPLAIEALWQSANLLAKQGVSAYSQADPANRTAAGRQAARQKFKSATSVAARVVELTKKKLALLPKPSDLEAGEETAQQRDALRTKQVEAQFLTALVSYEEAHTYEATEQQYSAALDRASQQFGELVEAHRDTVVEASSRFYQGLCAQERGQYQKALGCYEDIIKRPAGKAEFRSWTAKAHRRRLECLLAQGNVDEAIRDGEAWLDESRPEERQKAEWLEVSFRLAGAYKAKIDEQPEAGPKTRKLETDARNLLREVSEHPNEFQREARFGMTTIGRGRPKAAGEYKTFEEAFAAGKEAFEQMRSVKGAVALARQNNPDAVKELEEQTAQSKEDSIVALEQALALAGNDAPIDQLNSARYFLCWMYWEDGRLDEAAVLGQFLATRYPESEFASSAAQVAMAALEKIYNETRLSGKTPPAPGVPFAGQQLSELARLVAARWPSSDQAASAVNVLIGVALRDKRLEDAEKLLGGLPPESRAAAELKLGAALWTQYLQTPRGANDQPSSAAAAIRDKAAALLASGFEGLRQSGRPSSAAASGSLYLVQHLLAQGDAKAALKVLRDEKVGPLTLVEAKSDAAASPRFAMETYKAALRAYLMAEPPDRKNAQNIMKSLDAAASGQDDAGGDQLTRVYASLGLQLQKQLKQLTESGQHDRAAQVAAAFRDVMDRVAEQPGAKNWAIAKWVAETNLQLGQGLDPKEAKPYFDRAKGAYRSVLDAAKKGGTDAPDSETVLIAHKRLGDCLLALGEYQSAIDEYAAALRAKPMMIDIQQSAAGGLQRWGIAKKDLKSLNDSIHGALPQKEQGGKNLIWGWVRLAQVADNARQQAGAVSANSPELAERVERYKEIFFDARYNVAKARLEAADFAPAERRDDQLNGAKQQVESMRLLYPDMGGPKWKAKFDELLAQINKELQK